MNVHVLPDRRLLDAKTSLAALVERARALQVFGPTVDFDAPVWDLSPVKITRPSAGTVFRLIFSREGAAKTKSMKGRVPLNEAFGEMIKTIIALREFARPAKDPCVHGDVLQAGRLLYETLQNRGFDPVRLTSDDFFAAAFAVEGKPSYKYKVGGSLEIVAEFVNKHALAKARIAYSNPHPRPGHTQRTDEKSKKDRAGRMPSEELIDAVIAMSDIVREKGDDRDIIRAAAVELLMCAPWRINEALMLRAKCLRKKSAIDPKTGHPYEAFGFAYGASKGANDTIKWVPPKMVEVAERAMADILRITEPIRRIARWMERHPGRAYVAEPFRLADPSTLLTINEVAVAIGVTSRTPADLWLRYNGVPREKHDGLLRCTLADVEAAMLRLQPRLPPDMPQKLSDYLFLIPQHFFREGNNNQYGVVTFLSDFQIGSFLTSHEGHKSVFERLEIRDADHKPYKITSHAFRHYLNTIAKDGELPELDIARWSGRKRVGQNAAYDHTDGRQLKKRMREMLNTRAMRGPLPQAVAKLPPVEREAFVNARINSAHMTDIGACVQDWSLAPCPKHGSCAGCGDHLVIKGNPAHKARAERLLTEHESMLAQARTEMGEGTYGASEWVKHNEKMVEGLKRTVAVHADPEIPDGTAVQV
ncbi:hypothetical protein NLM33_39420 [Bradyrhizobium sp. CCGUVB1N3]|uniref:hypothetical protein n=1 Tax=Bradyrhizobium sp. CCGUVB1N3 TaxID=2949629 RepID=UPI0020B35FFF|nr:hypothetical protein [Bradyrhizobium sp. CCGUVB1N3]MCP3476291.1 hypothetical protein [Bradyrhizobium sp. CCGUVB1N3]